MKASKNLCLILSLLGTVFLAANILAVSQNEAKIAYVVLDDNGQDFLIVDELPTQDKVIAGANYNNAINQTG